MVVEHSFDELEFDRRHLRCQDRVAFLMFFGKRHALDRIGLLLALRHRAIFSRRLTLIHRYLQGTHTDTGRTEVTDFVDLQERIELALGFEDLLHLVGSNGIKAASERGQLHKLKIIVCGDIGGSFVKTCVIHPLVNDTDRTLKSSRNRDAVLT